MNIRTIPVCVVLGSVLIVSSGCMSTGNESLRKETESSVTAKIVEGKTAKSEIRSMFGSPLKTSFTDGGLEIWTYELDKVHADAIDYVPIVGLFGGSASGVKKELVILFDDKGIVKRYSMSESPVKTKTGLFNHG